MSHNLPWLYSGRAIRSFITSFLTVAFPLYLATSGFDASRIGLIIAVTGGLTVVLVTAVGFVADRFGRRTVLIGLALLSFLGSGAMAFFPASFAIAAMAGGLGGVGRGGGAGSGGSWGPVFPAEQPLIAASTTPQNRTRAFGRLSFVGVVAGALGSMVATLPEVLYHAGWSWASAYRLLFGIAAILSVIMLLVSVPIRETPPAQQTSQPTPLSTRQLLSRLGLTNGLNGFGIGFLGPLLTYWFYRRYGVGPAQIGVLYTIVNLAAALPYLGAARVAERLGTVRTVIATRGLGLVALLSMALVPQFWLAGAFYTLRMILNSLGMPARQSFVMGVSDARYQSRITALASLPSQVTSMISPAVAGQVMASFLDAPIIGAVLFMSLNVLTYYYSFRHVQTPEEQARAGSV